MKVTDVIRLISFVLLFFIAACVADKDTAYYLTHPEEIQVVYDQCLIRDKANQAPTPDCAAVFRAIPTVKLYLTELINSPESFALAIMAAQNQLVKLESSYQGAIHHPKDYRQLESLESAIAKQRLEIQTRYALIRLVHSMN